MKIKISDRFMNSITPNLIRNWCEALIDLPGVEYIQESSEDFADIGIDIKNNVGISVLYDSNDTQGLINIMDSDKFIDERFSKLLKVPIVLPSIIFVNNNSITIDDIDTYDIYAPTVTIEPSDKYIKPFLKHAKVIPLYHSIPEEIFFNSFKEREFDVFLSGAMSPQWYPLRNIFHDRLLQEKDLKYKYILGGGDEAETLVRNNNESLKDKQVAFDLQLMEYADNLRNSKVSLFCSSIFNWPLKKYIECMATGCLILAPIPIDAEYLEFKDGVNMVEVDENNFMDKIYYYLIHEDERKFITDNAYKLFKKRFTSKKSAEIFLNKLVKMKDLKLFINSLNDILKAGWFNFDINPILEKINKDRYLGSSNQCYKLMYNIAWFFNVRKILEIGTHKAASTIAFCQSMYDMRTTKFDTFIIHTIDNWSQASMKKEAINNIDSAGFKDNVVMYDGCSSVMVPLVLKDNGKMDLIFIDGDHHNEAVIRDFDNCKDFTDVIIFHDTENGNLPYTQYVKDSGFDFYNFETRYLEGDCHLVGLGLAIRK